MPYQSEQSRHERHRNPYAETRLQVVGNSMARIEQVEALYRPSVPEETAEPENAPAEQPKPGTVFDYESFFNNSIDPNEAA